MTDNIRTRLFWTVLQDGDGKIFVRSYDASEDRYNTLPVADLEEAEVYIRANSFKVIGEYNRYGERIDKPTPIQAATTDLFGLFSTRAKACLWNERVKTFEELDEWLARIGPTNLVRLPNVGPRTAREIIEMHTTWKATA